MPYKHKKDKQAQAKRWKEANREHVRSEHEKYRRKHGIMEITEYRKSVTLPISQWSSAIKDPKLRAHKLLQRAVRKNRIQKPATCSICLKNASSDELHGHHKDYSRWWEVEWVCRTCHFTVKHIDWGKAGGLIGGSKEAQTKRMKSLINNKTLGNNQYKKGW